MKSPLALRLLVTLLMQLPLLTVSPQAAWSGRAPAPAKKDQTQTQTKSKPKAKAPPSKPLFSRIGGKPAIARLVDRFVGGLENNPKLMANPALAKAKKRISIAAARRDLTDSLCQATGGPCKLSAKAFADVPTELQLAPMEWAIVLGEASQALQASKIPPQEQQELVALLLQYKNSAMQSQAVPAATKASAH